MATCRAREAGVVIWRNPWRGNRMTCGGMASMARRQHRQTSWRRGADGDRGSHILIEQDPGVSYDAGVVAAPVSSSPHSARIAAAMYISSTRDRFGFW